MRTRQKLIHLLDYCATHPDARLRVQASNMILHLDSDAGYNNETKARSRSGGNLYLGNHPDHPDIAKGAILNPTHVLKHVASNWSSLRQLQRSHPHSTNSNRHGTPTTTYTGDSR